jgi:hypothetical protein
MSYVTVSKEKMSNVGLPLAMVTLLAAAFGFNPAARAQDVAIASGVQGSGAQVQVQSVGNNSTQESNSMEAIGLLVTLEARPGKEADAEAFLKVGSAPRTQ